MRLPILFVKKFFEINYSWKVIGGIYRVVHVRRIGIITSDDVLRGSLPTSGIKILD